MKTGVVDQITTATNTITIPRRDCTVCATVDAGDEVCGSNDVGICFPFKINLFPFQKRYIAEYNLQRKCLGATSNVLLGKRAGKGTLPQV